MSTQVGGVVPKTTRVAISPPSEASLLDQLESMGDHELLQLALEDPDKYEVLLSGLAR